MKALLAVLIAGGFVLLSVVALELVSIRRSLRRIERDDRQLIVVIQRDLQTIHPAQSGAEGQAASPSLNGSDDGNKPVTHKEPLHAP